MVNASCRSWDGIVCPVQPLLLISEMPLSLPALSGPLAHFLSHLQPPQLFQLWEWMSILSLPCSGPSPSDDYTSLEWRSTEVVSRLEHMMYNERLTKLDLLSLRKRKAEGGDFFSVFNLLMSSCEARCFSKSHGKRIRGNRQRLQQGKFPLDKEHYSPR